MFMRESHDDQIVRWACFVREHPSEWKKIHTEFIDAIFAKHEDFRERILKTANGKEKLVQLYDIKNREGYSWLK